MGHALAAVEVMEWEAPAKCSHEVPSSSTVLGVFSDVDILAPGTRPTSRCEASIADMICLKRVRHESSIN